jgi:cell shape-determining protein MreC
MAVAGTIKDDVRLVLIAGALVIVGVIVLAFLDYRSALGLQGVSTIQSMLNFIDSIPNGLASLINDFFNWLGHFFSGNAIG